MTTLCRLGFRRRRRRRSTGTRRTIRRGTGFDTRGFDSIFGETIVGLDIGKGKLCVVNVLTGIVERGVGGTSFSLPGQGQRLCDLTVRGHVGTITGNTRVGVRPGSFLTRCTPTPRPCMGCVVGTRPLPNYTSDRVLPVRNLADHRSK